METAAFKECFIGVHLFLYLPVALLLTRILLNQLRLAPAEDRALLPVRFRPAYFLSTLFLILFAACFLVFGVLLLSSRHAVFPPILHEAAGIGSIFYWFLLSCFIAQWGRCFG